MDARIRKDRFDLSPRLKKSGKVEELQLTEWRIQLLLSFEDFKLQPTNWIQDNFPEVGPSTVQQILSRMAYKPYQWVERRTFHGEDNRNETMTYMRTPKGDEVLKQLGYQLIPRSDKQDREQALIDVVRLSTNKGAKAAGFEVRNRRDYWQDPRFKDAMSQFNGRFYMKHPEFTVYPDEFPTILRHPAGKAITFFEELDRATEDIKKITEKLTRYHLIWKSHLKRELTYGFPAPMLRFVTTSETRKRHLMEKTAHLFEGGKCGYILWASIEDHTVRRFTQPVTARFFDEPYERIGLPPFSLKEMREV